MERINGNKATEMDGKLTECYWKGFLNGGGGGEEYGPEAKQ